MYEQSLFNGQSLHHSMSIGQFHAPLMPHGYNLYPIARNALTEPARFFKGCSPRFYKILALSYDQSQFVAMLSPLFHLLDNIICLIVYESHSTPLLSIPHDLTPHSWIYDKHCQTSYMLKFCPEEE